MSTAKDGTQRQLELLFAILCVRACCAHRWPTIKQKTLSHQIIDGLITLDRKRRSAKDYSTVSLHLFEMHQREIDIPGMPSGHWKLIPDLTDVASVSRLSSSVQEHLPNPSFTQVQKAVNYYYHAHKSKGSYYYSFVLI